MRARWFVGGVLMVACGSSIPPLADEASGESGQSESGDSGDSGESGESEQPGPLDEPTGGELGCDPWQQDCAAGEKCTHYNSMGGHDEVDATQCMPIPPMPQPSGAVCTATGGFGAGVDDCGLGEFCYFLGGDDVGLCVPLCEGSAEAPVCPAGSFCSHGQGPLLYMCLPACDPVAQLCLEGAGCSPQADGFVCALDVSGEEGQIYDACEVANGCDPGLMCGPPGAAPGCAEGAKGCCLPLCEVEGTLCPDELECAALYDVAEHPELAGYGVCAAGADAGAVHAASLAASAVNSGPAAR